MVVSSINNYNLNNAKPLNFCAKTRSEKASERGKTYISSITVSTPEENLETLDLAKQEIERQRNEYYAKRQEEIKARAEEREYKKEVAEWRETRSIIREITQPGKDKNLFGGKTLQTIGKIFDIGITAILSGMALHWSTGHAYKKLHEVAKKPKVAKVIKNIKRPFQIVGSSLAEGLKTTWNTFAKKVKETKNGQKLLATKPMQKINKAIDEIGESYKNFKTDVKNLTPENIKSGVATTFGVSGAAATVVDKLDENQRNKD